MDGVVPATGLTDAHAGPLSGGRQHASGSGRADGGHFRPLGGGSDVGGFRFDAPVPAGGYVWWYVDAISADGRYGLSIIAFVGSVFSPYYSLARSRGGGDPLNHCALNVAFYNAGHKRWSMTERGRDRLHRTADSLVIGPSAVSWDGDHLTIRIEEVTAPIPSALRGTVRVFPTAIANRAFALDAAGRHRWQPIAPCAHVEVLMSRPSLRWHGSGYVDSNSGSEPIEDGFRAWTWSRADLRRGTAVLYDVASRGRSSGSLALLFNPSGTVEEFDPPPAVDLPRSRWKIARRTRSEDGPSVRVMKTLEDAPFYARSLISTRLLGQQAFAIHESLSLDRFQSRWVQAMLPFRMPRRSR
jgi:carotenoid 1,2-hydratase